MANVAGRRTLFGAFAVWIIAVIAFGLYMAQANEKIADRTVANEAQQTDIEAQKRTLAEANARLKAAGEPTVAAPEPVATAVPTARGGKDGLPGKAGLPGPPPSAAEIAAAVKTYCAANRCQGTDGKGVTASQVAAAVSTYCARVTCTGKDGTDGKDGINGKDGVDGKNGTDGLPGKDSDQAGKDGTNGTDGTDGKNGRGIAATTCTEEDKLVITYTDDTTDMVGTCKHEGVMTPPTTEPPSESPSASPSESPSESQKDR